MFNGLKRRLGLGQQLVQPEQVVDKIVGYNDIKLFLAKLEQSEQEMNIMFNGPRATAKSLFLDELEKRYPNCIRYDFSTTTGRGIINSIVEFKTEYQTRKGLSNKSFEEVPITLLIDEIDRIKPKTDLNVLYNLLEGKRITYTKFKFRVDLKIPNLRVFATCNAAEKLPAPFRSRFFIMDLEEYTLEQFIDIAKGIAPRYLNEYRENIDELAEQFAREMYPTSKDVRQLINCMKIFEVWEGQKTVAEVLGFRDKYRKIQTEEDQSETRAKPSRKGKKEKNENTGAPF